MKFRRTTIWIYLDACVSAPGIVADHKGPLFRRVKGRTRRLTRNPLLQQDVHRMIRATGITAYLKNGGKLEIAQQMAAHESSRITGLYDRRSYAVSLDEVERIAI